MPVRKVIPIIVVGIELVVAIAILFHIGENVSNKGLSLYKFTPLLGALFGSALTLFSIFASARSNKALEPWSGYERSSWILIGCGQIIWGLGESFWRYYSAISQSPFPSIADAGYACFPALCFVGLLSQPNSGDRLQRTLVALDSLIAMGALLAISWFLLLGTLAQTPNQDGLAKFLGLYYPTADASLLSCVVFLLMRGQSQLYQTTARKASLFIIGLGLCFFATSDFIFNLQQNAGTYVDGTWVDLGWPLGMITIGLAAYLRCFLPRTSPDLLESRTQERNQSLGFNAIQLLPYMLILALFAVLVANIVSTESTQVSIRVVLLIATIGVICLVLVRQILTIRDNMRLSILQARSLRQIEEQARHITERNSELEEGIAHLKAVQTSLANGNSRARAHLKQGILWSLASSLNLLAERLANLGEARKQSEMLSRALIDLGGAIERYRAGQPFKLPVTCERVPEITPILHAIGVQKVMRSSHTTSQQHPLEASPPENMSIKRSFSPVTLNEYEPPYNS
ncbi:MAG: hypothetical protein J2P37_15755 [Ktedonobacteraceae bacterium]|nr:hypothetical protein [Ktedonobacteraceae bacterium]